MKIYNIIPSFNNSHITSIIDPRPCIKRKMNIYITYLFEPTQIDGLRII